MWERLLLDLTSAFSFACLTASLWLGFYIVTRSPRSKVSWLAAATLWSLSGYFLNSLTYLHGVPRESVLHWWWGWSVAFAVPFWLHLSVSLLPEKPARQQRPLLLLVYVLTPALIILEAFTPWVFGGITTRLPIYSNAQAPGPLYPIFGLYLIAVPVLSLGNLVHGWRRAQSPLIQNQFAILIAATGLGILSGIYALFSTWLMLSTPVLVSDIGLGAGIILLGYGMARYNALIEGRAIERDFVYTSLAIGLIIAAYLLVGLVSGQIFGAPFIAFIFTILLAIISHSLYDWARSYLDRFFYRQQYRELRANLRDFVHSATPAQDIEERLRDILHTLCRSMGANKAFVALGEEGRFKVIAGWQAEVVGQEVAAEALETDDVVSLSSPAMTPALADMALILSLHAGGEQIGALVLGRRSTGVGYSEDDLDTLEDCADMVASVVHTVRLQEQNVQQINNLLAEFRQREGQLQGRMRSVLAPGEPSVVLAGMSERNFVALVEDALRHLQEYPYLGDHELAQLRIVELHLRVQEGVFVTHLDRGKALHEVLATAIEKLKPPGREPALPTREWHPYIILRDCYLLGKLNRDVMSTLYISEGTFNRIRRRAIRAVAKALSEMEKEAD